MCCVFPLRVDESFLDQVRMYLEKDVSQDIDTMTTPTPNLGQLKLLFQKDCAQLHKWVSLLIKIWCQFDVVEIVYSCMYMFIALLLFFMCWF